MTGLARDRAAAVPVPVFRVEQTVGEDAKASACLVRVLVNLTSIFPRAVIHAEPLTGRPRAWS